MMLFRAREQMRVTSTGGRLLSRFTRAFSLVERIDALAQCAK